MRHYSIRTEEVYVIWVRRYIYFHGMRQPKTLSARHVNAFLSHLIRERNVAASTQNQALCALCFCIVGYWRSKSLIRVHWNAPNAPGACRRSCRA